MADFLPSSGAYNVDYKEAGSKEVYEVAIDEIEPVIRGPGVGIFNDKQEMTARERVDRILRGFASGAKIAPVEGPCRQCQSKSNQSDKRWKPGNSSRHLTPFRQRGGAVLFEGFAAIEVAVKIEVIVN